MVDYVLDEPIIVEQKQIIFVVEYSIQYYGSSHYQVISVHKDYWNANLAVHAHKNGIIDSIIKEYNASNNTTFEPGNIEIDSKLYIIIKNRLAEMDWRICEFDLQE